VKKLQQMQVQAHQQKAKQRVTRAFLLTCLSAAKQQRLAVQLQSQKSQVAQ
jgi:hypothetical protein